MNDTPIFNSMKYTPPKTDTASITPNIVISSPKARRIIRTSIDIIGLAVSLIVVIDVNSASFDISEITVPAIAALLILRNTFGLTVDNSNTPKE